MKAYNLKQIQSALRAGELTMEQLINHYLTQSKDYKELNVYVHLYEDEIRQKANTLSRKINSNPDQLGQLFGLVISIKDVICYKDHPVTAGSKILDGFESQFTATALQRLLDEDALVIGHTNCDEFAMGSGNENSCYGPTINMDGENRVPGGSSGATAVSVQIDSCLVGIGSDTGGSVRQPAAFCGLTGIKPTYGAISRYGLIAYGSSLDQIGLIGRDVEDLALVLEIMSGYDDFDATSSRQELKELDSFENLDKASFAYFNKTLDHPAISPAINASFKQLISDLGQKEFGMTGVSFELLEYLVPTYYVLSTAEASSNLSRFDGIRYGLKADDVTNLYEQYAKTRTNGFGREVKRRIMLGSFILSAGYYDAYYTKAQKVRRLLLNEMDRIFEQYDFLLMPTVVDVAWQIGSFNQDPVSVYLSDIFTVMANLVGYPAISIPLGKDPKDNMSFGLQIMSKKFNERQLLSIAKQLKTLA